MKKADPFAITLDDAQKHALAVWLSSLEPLKRHYWQAAARRIAEEMEPLYWRVLPDKDHVDEKFWSQVEANRLRRMDWLLSQKKRV